MMSTRILLALTVASVLNLGCKAALVHTSDSKLTGTFETTCPKPRGAITLTENQEVLVIKIADGDTFTACTQGPNPFRIRVRVLGIDCPESSYNDKCERDGKEGRMGCERQVPLGREATNRAIALIKDRVVKLESRHANGNFEQDDYGRVLSYVRLEDGLDYGLTMIRESSCWDFSWRYPHPREEEYKKSVAPWPEQVVKPADQKE